MSWSLLSRNLVEQPDAALRFADWHHEVGTADAELREGTTVHCWARAVIRVTLNSSPTGRPLSGLNRRPQTPKNALLRFEMK